MKRVVGVLVAGCTALAVATSSASADPQGVPDCFGQQVQFYATTYGGVVNAADSFGLTVQQGHNVLLGQCGRTHGVIP